MSAPNRRHSADGGAPAVEHVLDRVAPEPARRAPDEDHVALGDRGAVARDEHAVRGRVAQRVDRGLLPAEVRGLGHELVRLGDCDVSEPAEVGLEPPDPLVHRQHRVVMRGRVLVVDVVAVDRHPVPGAPPPDRRAHPQHHPGGVRPDHVVVDRVALPPDRLAAEPVEEPERGERLEDRGPDGVEVDGGGHHRDVGLVGGELGQGDLADDDGLAGVLVLGGDPVEHRSVLAPHVRRPVGRRQRRRLERRAVRSGERVGEDLVHRRIVLLGRAGAPWPEVPAHAHAR